MATTAGGLPYVEPSDLVSGWPAVSQSLAEELDDQLAGKAALAGATYTGTHDFTGATVTGIESGLALITKQSFTTASAVNVNNCFTSTYDRYLITVGFTASVGANALQTMRLRASGTDSSASYQTQRVTFFGTTVQAQENDTGTDDWTIGSVDATNPKRSSIEVTLINPALASPTVMMGRAHVVDSSGVKYPRLYFGDHNVSTAYDGFTLITAGTSITGTVHVYAFKNS